MSYLRKAANVYFNIAGGVTSVLVVTNLATHNKSDPLTHSSPVFEKKFIPVWCALSGVMWPILAYQAVTDDYPLDMFRHLPENPVERAKLCAAFIPNDRPPQLIRVVLDNENDNDNEYYQDNEKNQVYDNDDSG